MSRIEEFEARQARFKAIAPKANHGQRMDFARRLAAMQAEAGALGLSITARALHSGPIQCVGWEISGETEKAAQCVPPWPVK
jgi:hypothetical protein